MLFDYQKLFALDIFNEMLIAILWNVAFAASASYEPTVNEVKVPILHRDICNDWLVQLNVTDGMICAGYSEGDYIFPLLLGYKINVHKFKVNDEINVSFYLISFFHENHRYQSITFE